MRFGTTTVPDSESLNEAFSTSDILRRGVRQIARTERDDRAASGTTMYRIEWRGGERGEGVG
jgi:hypothetical protein